MPRDNPVFDIQPFGAPAEANWYRQRMEEFVAQQQVFGQPLQPAPEAQAMLQVDMAQMLDEPRLRHRDYQEPDDADGGEELAVPKGLCKGFCPDYENLADIRMRLERTIILVAGEPTYVWSIKPYRNDFRIYTLRNMNERPKFFYYKREKDNLDLRGPPPGYLIHDQKTLFLARTPTRQQQQGLTRSNTILYRVGTGQKERMGDAAYYMAALRNRKMRPWSQELNAVFKDGLLTEVALSNHVAVYQDRNNGKICAEYKGRFLGELSKGKVIMSPEDYDKSWIKNAVQTVQLEPTYG